MLLPYHPKPFDDELLSSWMVRLALGNGYFLHTFYNKLLNYKKSLWNRDPDRNPDVELMELLSNMTAVPFDKVMNLSLNSYEGVLFSRLPLRAMPHWLLPLGVYHRTYKCHGVQFCPRCLDESDAPHFRKSWRISLLTVCPKHLVLLLDSCPCCHSSIAFPRSGIGAKTSDMPSKPISVCSSCGYDLGRSPVEYIENPSGDIYKMYLKIISWLDVDPGPEFHWLPGNLVAVFDGMRYLVGVAAGRSGSALRKLLVDEIGPEPPRDRNGMSDFDWQSVEFRNWAMRLVSSLLINWPERFIQTFKSTKINYSGFTDHIGKLPYWIYLQCRWNLLSKQYVISDDEIMSAGEYLMFRYGHVSLNSMGDLFGCGKDLRINVFKRWQLICHVAAT